MRGILLSTALILPPVNIDGRCDRYQIFKSWPLLDCLVEDLAVQELVIQVPPLSPVLLTPISLLQILWQLHMSSSLVFLD